MKKFGRNWKRKLKGIKSAREEKNWLRNEDNIIIKVWKERKRKKANLKFMIRQLWRNWIAKDLRWKLWIKSAKSQGDTNLHKRNVIFPSKLKLDHLTETLVSYFPGKKNVKKIEFNQYSIHNLIVKCEIRSGKLRQKCFFF